MKVIVVGGGAAGMMAAYSAAYAGHEVILAEGNEKTGKKLFITGKGRCNLTNNSSIDSFYSKIIRNPKFLYSSFDVWDNGDMIDFINSMGVKTKVERGERVFPVSDHSSDIIKALNKSLSDLNVAVLLNTRVLRLIISEGAVRGVECGSGESLTADHVILACGGCSYSSTGSDGSGFKLAESAGHRINTPRPALVPLICEDPWTGSVQGLSLKNVEVSLRRSGKTVFHEMGEMLFTDRGVSGPVILSLSSLYEQGDEVYIDLKPALDAKALDARILRDFEAFSNKDFGNSLDKLLPKSLIPVIVELSGIDFRKKVNQVTSDERKRLGELLKCLKLHVTGTAGFDEAIITRGGVSVKEIDPRTLQSKLVKGLSFAGEMIDVDAVTGGYNLQIAWSTGYTAGLKAGW